MQDVYKNIEEYSPKKKKNKEKRKKKKKNTVKY